MIVFVYAPLINQKSEEEETGELIMSYLNIINL